MTQVKKKAKVGKLVSPDKLRELATQAMEEFTAEAKARYAKAHRLYEEQNDATQDALDRMTTLLCRVARRKMWVSTGKQGDKYVLQIPEETVYHNMFFMAVEIVKDLAQFDVKVADFKFSPVMCVECYEAVKPKKKTPVKKKGAK